MGRTERMDWFLKYYAKVCKQNPDVRINKSTIYAGLMDYGLSQDEKRKRIRPLFNKWIDHFKNKNLKVFHAPEQDGFLQFHNKDYSKNEYVKIYLSFKAEDMEECVNIIFDYIDRNNFKTFSKVADMTRSDSVVLRMCEVEDAKKIIDFVNNNEQLRSKAKPVNPFTIQDGIVGMANDRYLSYNSTVSFLISEYFKNIKDYDQVSLQDFRKYVSKLYEDIFVNKTKLEKFKNTSEFKDHPGRFGSENEEIVNYYQIFLTILMSLKGEVRKEEFFKHVEDCQDNNKFYRLVGHFYDYEEKRKNNEKAKDIEVEQDKAKDVKKQEILESFVLYASKKYGAINVPIILRKYIEGDNNAITRDKNFREIFRTNLSKEDIMRITNNNVELFVQLKHETSKEMLYYFINAIQATYEKYGFEQACYALNRIFSGDFSYVTNGSNKYRQTLKNYDYDKLLGVINSYFSGIEFKEGDDYIKTLVSNMVDKEDKVVL